MELLLRIRWRVIPADDVRVEVEPDHTIGDLLESLNTMCGGGWERSQPVYIERIGNQLDLDMRVLESGLVSGDTVRFEMFGVDPSAWAAPGQAVSCDVVAGPEAGRSVVLPPGLYRCGRSPANAITFDDPTIADEQFTITVSTDLSTSITPNPAARNPLLVNGAVIDAPRVVAPTDTIQFGATAVSLRVFARAADGGRDQLGQILFNRTPHRGVVVTERPFAAMGTVPTKPEPRRFALLSAVLPLGSGLLLFAFSGQVQFLALTLLSPIALAGNWFEDRKAGRHKYADDVVAFHESLVARRDVVAGALEAERIERSAQSPDLADLARRAALRTIDLWARQRDDADHLRLRLGLGAVATKITVESENNGDAPLKQAASDAVRGFDQLPASPVCVALAEAGVVGFHGDHEDVFGLAGSLVVQATTLHSPEDLVVITMESSWGALSGWAKWLPHTRSATSPVAGDHVVAGAAACNELLRELVAVARRRTASTERIDLRWPWVLVAIEDDPGIDPAVLSQLLDLCPQAGITVVALAGSETRLPRQAAAVVDCRPSIGGGLSTIWYADPAIAIQHFEPEVAGPRLTDRVALALAPLRDATAATATSAIPRTVPLFALFGMQTPTPMSIAQNWATPKPYGLAAAIGTGPNGPLVLDLVEHGPHALIGGTSGAGKSELLQSIVAALVAEYPPTRLTFLFVDYKGGASSAVFNGIPHTVGYVTNLEANLALRALTSLRAELNYRMQLMQGKAKDLPEMMRRFPDEAPPSLVIVVDEFATLVKEVPDFVAGIVDVAQRGRSLGIHLILATQRPSGSVNDNILANTNLRISLRMLDAAESSSIIGVGTAAEIPVPLKGRGYARLGPRDITEFQSGFTGAIVDTARTSSPVHASFLGTRSRRSGSTRSLEPVGLMASSPSATSMAAPVPAPVAAPDEPDEPLTQLDVLLEAVAAAMPNLPPARKPWREPLADVIALDDVIDTVAAAGPAALGRDVLIGVSDDPAKQSQYPTTVNLEDGGGLLIVGGGGSGKTSALRTIAVSATHAATTDQVTLFVLDCASRALLPLRELPHCAAVVTGDDLEGLTRVIAFLERELQRRREILSSLEVQAESLSAHLDKGAAMTRIVVLVDGYQNLVAILNSPAFSQLGSADWLGTFHGIVTEGRQVGIHVVLAADRRQSVPALIMSAVSSRLVLRQSDESAYADLGVPAAMARGLELQAGRGVVDGLVLQVASVSFDPIGSEQGAAIRRVAAAAHGVVPPALTSTPPHDHVTVPPPRPGLAANVGRADISQRVVEVDFTHFGMIVVGPQRSGRTTALRQIAASLIAGGAEVWTVGLGVDLGGRGKHCGAKPAMVTALFQELLTLSENLAPVQQRVLVIDNVDKYDDMTIGDLFMRLRETDAIRAVGSMEMRNYSGYTPNQLLQEIRSEPTLLVLQPENAIDVMQMTGVRVALRPGLAMSSGRGVIIVDRIPTTIQVATGVQLSDV